MMRHNLPEQRWRKSSYSADSGPQCVEVQLTGDGLQAVGDSKARERGAFVFSAAGWNGFVAALRRGELGA